MAKDLFSGHADQYALYRPTYPQELFEWLTSHTPEHKLAWDAGTGNGQAAVALAPFFERVLATDLSQNQLANAVSAPNVTYLAAPAEQCPLPDHSADLITVGQALHWFDFEAFAQEVWRVAKPGAFFAAWTYSLCQTDPISDALIGHFYTEIVGPYWDARRRFVDDGYRGISLPISEVTAPAFKMEVKWNLTRLCDYLRTWSSVQAYLRTHGQDPVDALQAQLAEQWPLEEARRVFFPLVIRAGVVE
jgi:ubiquinone/menaquinone biosynthesis C-methylase UbiE